MFKNKDAREAWSSTAIVQDVIADFVQIDSGSARLTPTVQFIITFHCEVLSQLAVDSGIGTFLRE